jgi:hypothetical protein
MHFPVNAGLIFLMAKLTNDRYLVDTLSVVPCNQNSSPSGPLLKGTDGQPIPSWGYIQKTAQFQSKLFTSSFLQATVAGHILGVDFLRKFKVTVAQPNTVCLHCCCLACPLFAFSSPVNLAIFVQLPVVATSSQPPAISVHEVRTPEMKSSSFNFLENQSLSVSKG